VKSQAKVGRDTRGLRLDKPHRLPGQRPISNDRGSTGRRRRDAQGRVIEKSYDPLSWGM
jgi:hypothetical protein